jgi:Lrp/AsnC family transcriptional regulator for asnA, asnC and gidA
MTLAKGKLDDLDRKIILELQKNARCLYKDIAVKFNTSKSTISNRVNRLIDAGILKLEARVDPFQIENKVAAVIGVNIEGRGHLAVIEEIEKIPGVTSVWIATGKYDLFVEVMADSITDLTEFILIEGLDKLQNIKFTESFILLHSNTKYFKLY